LPKAIKKETASVTSDPSYTPEPDKTRAAFLSFAGGAGPFPLTKTSSSEPAEVSSDAVWGWMTPALFSSENYVQNKRITYF